MDEPYDPTRPTLKRLEDELRESAEDAAAGRVIPVEQVLSEMRSRFEAYRNQQDTDDLEGVISPRT